MDEGECKMQYFGRGKEWEREKKKREIKTEQSTQ